MNKTSKISSALSIGTVLIGAGLEYYGYMLFTLMIPIISPIFNGGENAVSALTTGYLIVFIGALMRPLGGLIIGYIGDKKGRSLALFWAMMMMAASSFVIPFLPTYVQMGAWASLFLLICRMIQTMSAASELNGAGIFVIEALDTDPSKSKRGLGSGLAWCFTVLGMLGASVASYYSDATNWHLPFLIGGIIGVFAIILRLLPKVDHGPKEGAKSAKKAPEFSLMRSATSSILIASGISGMFYYNMIWMIGNLQCRLDSISVREYSMYYFAIYSVMLLLSGILSDKVKKMYRPMMVGIVLMAALAFPTLYMKNLTFNIINVVLLALYVGPSHAVLSSLFPKEYRFRGVSITYSIGTSIIGGITPYICNKFGSVYEYFPACWLIFVTMLAFTGVFLSRKFLVRE